MTKSQNAYIQRTMTREEWKAFYQFMRARRAAGDPVAERCCRMFTPPSGYVWESLSRAWAFEMKTDEIPF